MHGSSRTPRYDFSEDTETELTNLKFILDKYGYEFSPIKEEDFKHAFDYRLAFAIYLAEPKILSRYTPMNSFLALRSLAIGIWLFQFAPHEAARFALQEEENPPDVDLGRATFAVYAAGTVFNFCYWLISYSLAYEYGWHHRLGGVARRIRRDFVSGNEGYVEQGGFERQRDELIWWVEGLLTWEDEEKEKMLHESQQRSIREVIELIRGPYEELL